MRVFKHLSELQGLVDQEIGVSDWITVDQQRIDLFAQSTGDHQWIHVDPERAAKGPFGTTIAHGFLTLSLLPEMSATAFDVEDAHMGVNYGLNKVRFPAAVRVGKRIRLRSKLLAVEEIGDRAIQMTSRQTIEIEGEERPACVAETVGRTYL